jgi:hypothetical protein
MRTKQTARKSTGRKAPRKQVASKKVLYDNGKVLKKRFRRLVFERSGDIKK